MLVFFFTCLSEWLDYNLLHKEQVNWCQSDLLHRWSVSKRASVFDFGIPRRQGKMLSPVHLVQKKTVIPVSGCFGKLRTLAPCSFFWCWLRVREETTGEGETQVDCGNTRSMDGTEKKVFAAHNMRIMGCQLKLKGSRLENERKLFTHVTTTRSSATGCCRS